MQKQQFKHEMSRETFRQTSSVRKGAALGKEPRACEQNGRDSCFSADLEVEAAISVFLKDSMAVLAIRGTTDLHEVARDVKSVVVGHYPGAFVLVAAEVVRRRVESQNDAWLPGCIRNRAIRSWLRAIPWVVTWPRSWPPAWASLARPSKRPGRDIITGPRGRGASWW